MKKIFIVHFLLFLAHAVNAQWIQQITGTSAVLNSVDALSGSGVAAACGTGGLIIRTTNGGDNWVSANSNVSSDLLTVKMRNTSTGYIGGANGVLLRTTNSGANWEALNFGGTETVNAIDVYPSTVMFIATAEGRVYRSNNSGDNFTMLADLTAGTLNTIESLGPGFIITAGDSGKVFLSTNNGDNWANIFIPQNQPVRDIGFFNASLGYCIGSTDVFKTTNAGVNWVSQAAFPPGLLSMFLYRFSGPDTVFISGVSGRMFKTNNGGINWFQQATGTGDVLLGIIGISNTTLYSCGSSGKILKTTNGGGNFMVGLNSSSSEIPQAYSLGQNYPNPFNPATTISFGIPKHSHVHIIVYDMLGKEVAELLNEELGAGSYSVDFNAASLPCGTYFYRITAGEFTEVKKMILIK